RRELPTHEDLAQEFPAMSVIRLRVEIERALRDRLAHHGVESGRPAGIISLLRDLQEHELAPASTDHFLKSLQTMNEAVHGFDVDPQAIRRAIEIGTQFLLELSQLGSPDT